MRGENREQEKEEGEEKGGGEEREEEGRRKNCSSNPGATLKVRCLFHQRSENERQRCRCQGASFSEVKQESRANVNL